MSAATHPTCKGVFNNKKPCTFKAKLGCNGFCRVHNNQANKDTIIANLEKENKKLKEDVRWFSMENGAGVEMGAMLGDGKVSYEEWIRWCRDIANLDEEDLQSYKDWLGYQDGDTEEK